MRASAKTTLSADGFLGNFYESTQPSHSGMIVVMGDSCDDILNTACAKWLTRCQGCHALSVGLIQKKGDIPGVHNWPLERIQAAVRWLHHKGITQVGIIGISMQASLALTASSLIPELSLTVGISPNDFVPWGFFQKSGKEWPSGDSAFSWKGEALSFQPAGLEKVKYWQMYQDSRKKYSEMHSRTIFDYSESIHPIEESCFIKAEDISGTIVLIGAEDDSMWNSAGYIRRMEKRLTEKGCPEKVKALVYPYGTHLLIPERMLKAGIPVFGDMISRLYVSGKQHPKECRAARMDADQKLTEIITQWKEGNSGLC